MKKIIVLSLLFLPVSFFYLACTGGGLTDDCGPFDTDPYFDYSALGISAPDTVTVASAALTIRPEEIEYLATSHFPRMNSFGSLYACSPLPDGYEGQKFENTRFELRSNRPYAPSRGIDVDLATVAAHDGIAIGTSTPQFEVPDFGDEMLLQLTIPPDTLGIPFHFELTITKADGTTVVGESAEVFWVE